MTEHTKEPWKVAYRGAEGAYDIDASGSHGWGDVSLALNVGENDARRIVACVNAMAGIGDDNVLFRRGSIGTVRKHIVTKQVHIEKLTAQRDQLLAALEGFDKAMEEACDWPDTGSERKLLVIAVRAARAAIAAVKGDHSDNTL